MYVRSRRLKQLIRENSWDEVKSILSETPGLVNFSYSDEAMLVLGTTPLFIAVELCLEGGCDVENVAYLLNKGADPNKLSLYEGDEYTPLFLCTTTTKPNYEKALHLATMLLREGANINAQDLLPSTIIRMHETPSDYDGTMVTFMCRHGSSAVQKQRALCILIPLRGVWVVSVASCLLNEGAYIYFLRAEIHCPHYLSSFSVTPVSKLVKDVDQAIFRVKNLRYFDEHVVHHARYLDVPIKQWKSYAKGFDRVIKTIERNERCGYLALKHPSSKASALPSDVFWVVMNYVTSATASRRIKSWS